MRYDWISAFLCGALVFTAGCGPSAREQTISTLNTVADAWDGGPDFRTMATDAYDRPIVAKVSKGTLNYSLELRSHGRDGLPQNSDDIVVYRSKAHGDSSVKQEIEKISESIGRGGVRGAVQGAKQALTTKDAPAKP